MKNSKQSKQTKLTGRTPALKGAVLIMVMTVMFVLIFLLAGTIAVVYSAHNRAMLKYEESQAYYTARSTLDAYLDAFLKDNDNQTGDSSLGSVNTVAVPYYYINNTTSPASCTSINAKQGRALELDIYGLKVSVAPKGAGGLADADYPYDGVTESIWSVGNYANDKYLYDWVKQYILDLALGDFNVPAGQTLEDFRDDYATHNAASYAAARTLALKAINSKLTDYNHTDTSLIPSDSLSIETTPGYAPYYKQFTVSETGDTLYYRVPANTFTSYGNAGTSGSFGKVADTFSDGDTDAIITVQLLERTMNLSKDGADYKLKFDGGNREKDHVKIKVTCEIMLDGISTTTSVMYANEYVQKPSSNKAIVSLSDVHSGTSLKAFGGVASMATAALNWTNNSGTSGNAYFRGDVNFGTTTPAFVLNSSNIFYSDGTITVGANRPRDDVIEAGATFFSKRMEIGQQGFGSTGHEVNAICEEFVCTNSTSGGGARMFGKVFAENFDITSGMGNNTKIVEGDLYTNYITFSENDLYYNFDPATATLTITIDQKSDNTGARQSDQSFKNMYTGNLNIAKGIKIKKSDGTIITADINGQVEQPAGSGTMYNVAIGWSANMSNITLNDTLVVRARNRVLDSTADSVTPDNDRSTGDSGERQDFSYDSTTKKRTFVMPAALVGKSGSDANKVELDTLESMYSDYFKSAPVAAGPTVTYDGDSFDFYGDFNDKGNGTGFYFEGSTGSRQHLSAFDSTVSGSEVLPSADFQKFISEHVVTPADRNAKVNNTGLTAPSILTSYSAQTTSDPDIQAIINASGKTFGGVISSDCMIPAREDMASDAWYNNLGNYLFVIDTRSGPVDIQMGNGDGGAFGGNYAVLGTNKCTLLLPAASAGTKFFFGTGNADFSLYDSRLGNAPSALNLGTAANPSVPPAIDIVVSENVEEIEYGQKAPKAIQGYVYAPFTKFILGGGANGHDINISVDNFSGVGTYKIMVIGSIFCKGFKGSQDIGVAFIDPNAVTAPPGDKVFAWSDVYYQRGV